MGNSRKIHRLWTKMLAAALPIIAAICVCFCVTGNTVATAATFVVPDDTIIVKLGTKDYTVALGSDLSAFSDEVLDPGSIAYNVDLQNDIEQVAAGYENSYVLFYDGTVMSAGRGDEGALGNGSTNDSGSFTRVKFEGDADVKATAIAAGEGFALLIDEDGGVWGTGRNEVGQLGDNSGEASTVFKRSTFSGHAVAVDCGRNHSVIMDDRGKLWGVGMGSYGQLGNGTTKFTNKEFIEIPFDGIVKDFACSYFHTVVIDDKGQVWGAGQNAAGQLGLGWRSENAKEGVLTFTKSTFAGNAVAVDGGRDFSVIIDNNGKIWGSGRNNFGMLGLGYTNSEDEPIVSFTKSTFDGVAKKITCGDSFTTIIDNNGSLWSTGRNTVGQLGNQSKSDTSSFIRNEYIAKSDGFDNVFYSVAGGNYHSLTVYKVRVAESIYNSNLCVVTGENARGQLGKTISEGAIAQFTSPDYVDQPAWLSISTLDFSNLKVTKPVLYKAFTVEQTNRINIKADQLSYTYAPDGNSVTLPAKLNVKESDGVTDYKGSYANQTLQLKRGDEVLCSATTDKAGNATLTYTENGGAGTYQLSLYYVQARYSQPYELTIDRAPIEPSVTLDGWTYGSSANEHAVTGNTGGGNVSLLYTGTSAGGISYESTDAPVAAGSYKLTVTIEQSTNYLGGTCYVEFLILPKKITVTVDGKTSVYGAEQSPLTYAADEGALVQGDTTEGLGVSLSKAQGETVGRYLITGSATNSNYDVEFTEAYYEITKATYDMNGAGWNYTEAFTYDGTEKTVAVTGLPEGVTVAEYSGNAGTNAGEYSASVTLAYDETNYNAPPAIDSLVWTINKATYDMSGAGWNYTDAFTYDGTEKTVEVTGLPTGVTVAEYAGNTGTNAGDYTASVTFTYDEANYNAPTLDALSWTINKATYDMNGAGWNYTDAFTYDGTEKTVEVTGLPASVTVAEYAGNTGTNAGEYSASVTLTYDKINYNAPTLDTLNWTIKKATYDMSGAAWNYTEAFTYDGTEKAVAVTGLPEGVTVAEYAGNVATNAGEYSASVTLAYDETNYNMPTLNALTWTINKATYDMSGAGWNYTDAFTYDGTEKTIEVTGLPTGVTVAEYAGNTATNAGEYSARVTFAYDESNYNAPTLDALTWTISKATYDMSGAGWNYTDAFTYDGTEKTVEVTGLPTGVTVAAYAGNTGTNAGDYTASVTFTYDEANYNAPTLDALTWTIIKATYDMSGTVWNYTDAFTYDGTEKTIEVTGLPTGVTVSEYAGNTGTNAGEYSASVTFAYDEANYNAPTLDALTWTINKATYNMTGVKFQNAKVTYDGKSHSLTITGTLPKGVTVKYVGNDKTVVGTYEVTAKFTGDPNYEPIADMKATLTIEKAPDPDPVDPEPEKGGCNGCGGSVTDGIALAGTSAVLLFLGIVIAVRKARKKK